MLVFFSSTWIWVAYGGLEQSSAVLRIEWGHDLQTGAVTVPGGEALGMLGCHARCCTVRPPECDGDRNLGEITTKIRQIP